ncbi:hypothetical protein GCM10022214_87450 [Actinomadura miaoliensis]|uniref:Uncharacterized protein n=1 Tax=Actinomadura miaoliensis TaxID=430685 RepID=A0ABP7X7Z9_9ACTN
MDARDRHYVADAGGRTPGGGVWVRGRARGRLEMVNARRCGNPHGMGTRDAADEGGGADDAIR